jgi:hypothetical protein
MHVNLPNEWKTSGYGVKYFRAEGFDYDIWQKNTTLMRQTLEFSLKLGRPASECMYLAGIYGPPDRRCARPTACGATADCTRSASGHSTSSV